MNSDTSNETADISPATAKPAEIGIVANPKTKPRHVPGGRSDKFVGTELR